jgi:hypothetical protein
MVDVRIKAGYRIAKSGGLVLHMVDQRNMLFARHPIGKVRPRECAVPNGRVTSGMRNVSAFRASPYNTIVNQKCLQKRSKKRTEKRSKKRTSFFFS